MITGSSIELLWLFMSCFVLLFSLCCINGLLNLPIWVQLSVQNPFIVVKGLIIMNHLHSLGLYTVWIPVAKLARIYFPMNRNIPSRGGIPGAGCASVETQKADAGVGAVPRCAGDLVWEPGRCAWREREWNVCFLDVSFKWGESYKKHTSTNEPQSQGQRPVRQVHGALHMLGTHSCYSYTSSASKTFITVQQYFIMVLF